MNNCKEPSDTGHRWLAKALAVAIPFLLYAVFSSAAEPVTVTPEDVGLSSARLQYMDSFYDSRVKKGEMAGIVTLVARHGKVAHVSAIGFANAVTGQTMQRDTLFRLYSMTKPITATALMMLYEEGRFQLDDPISKFIPDFKNLTVLRHPDAALDDVEPVKREATIQDLLRHTAGFGLGLGSDFVNRRLADLGIYGRDVSLEDMMKKVAQVPLRYQPGTRWAYSLSPDVEARLVEILSGLSFDQFLKNRVFGPLGMADTTFWVTPAGNKRLSAVHWTDDGKIVPWDTANGNPLQASHQGGFGDTLQEPFASINKEVGDRKLKPGSIGLIGTAHDYWRFAQMLLNGGTFNGVRLLGPETIHYMMRDHLGAIDASLLNKIAKGTGFGLGLAVTHDPAAAAFMNGEGSIWWDGVGSTLWWDDPKNDLVVIAMTQYMGSGPNLSELRPQIRALVYAALETRGQSEP